MSELDKDLEVLRSWGESPRRWLECLDRFLGDRIDKHLIALLAVRGAVRAVAPCRAPEQISHRELWDMLLQVRSALAVVDAECSCHNRTATSDPDSRSLDSEDGVCDVCGKEGSVLDVMGDYYCGFCLAERT